MMESTRQLFNEGININKDLLPLKAVILALDSNKTQGGTINCGDSLLKDPHGRSNVILMIACVSPAHYKVEETL
ncbi:kinesin-4B [Trypoxylus dichotomus]